jgi:hypothetical protein
MTGRLVWLSCVTGVFWAATAGAAPNAPASARPHNVPLEEVAAPVRERVRQVVEQPTLSAHGPTELFRCQPATYYWLLENQDRASIAWRRLGARCVEISNRGQGCFGWSDGSGSDVRWNTVCCRPDLRVWYAEGVVRPGLLLPTVPIRAVAVLRHSERLDEQGRTTMTQQLSLYLHADSKTVTLASRLFGASVPRMAEQYTVQMELFFSALARYLERHPDQAEALLSDAVRLTPTRP